MKRRQFIARLSALTAAGSFAGTAALRDAQAAVPAVPTDTGASGRVVVVGGGMAGATAAKYLRLWGGAKVEVTLVERSNAYVSNILSNLVLNDGRTIAGLTYGWNALSANYGVARRSGEVVAVDANARRITLANGETLDWDRLVLAPGLDFDPIAGIESAALQDQFPHAWRAGPQTQTLRNQLRAMAAGGTVVITVPKTPFRGGSAPYARAALIADWLTRNKPGSRVIVLDANAAIAGEPMMFTHAFNVNYSGIIDYVPNALIDHIDPGTRTVHTSAGSFKGDVINPIPPQRAPKFLYDSNLVNDPNPVDSERRWVGVDAMTYEHLNAPRVHVIGDPAHHGMPKAGHIANQQGKVCADAITRMLRGDAPDPNPVTNSAAFSPVSLKTSSWLAVVYRYNAGSRRMEVVNGALGVASKESGRATQDNFDTMNKWFRQLMNDSFA